MLSKFRLDRRNKYECRLLILKLAEMLEGVASAVPHAIEIGSEQGGIPHWDDIVEIRCDGTILHTQVKRQSTDFNSSSPTRPSRSSELSVLDSALESLARSIDREDLDASGKRFFELMVFGPGILVKKGIRIEQFDEIVTLFSTNSISCEKMADRQDAAKEAVFQWLTTWCGFRDWAHISMVLSRLSIKFCGTEVEVDSRTMGSLAKIFKDPSAAKDSLSTYVFDEASDVGAISSRAMMKHLKHLLRPDVPSWTQYRKVGGVSCWELSGIHDLEDQDAERATGVVASLWGTDGQRRILQLHAPHTSMDVSKIALPHAILRLALHLNGASQCLLEDASAWKTKAGDLTGQTIGCSASDLTNLPWAESQPRPGAPMRHLAGISESSAEATSLMHAMDERVRSQLKSRVNDSLERVMDEELQSELANLWSEWCRRLEEDPEASRALFSSLLHPATEGLSQGSLLRIGPRALDLLESAVMTLLVVAVSIGGKGSTWNTFTDCGHVLSIALKQWSGPVGGRNGKRSLQSDELQDIIGPNPDAVVVLSGIESPADSLLEPAMSGVAYDATSLMAERRPKVLVTGHNIDRFLRKGKLEHARTYFKNQWDAQIAATELAASNAADGKQ